MSKSPSRRRRENQRAGSKRRKRRFLRVARRDKWLCWLCGEKVDPRAEPLSPEGATLDHVVRLRDGGLQGDNLRLAHRRCNEARG